MLFVWEKFGPYHMDRCEACARHFAERYEIIGVEIASYGDIHRWDLTGPGERFRKITLFPNVSREAVSPWRYFTKLVLTCLTLRPRYIFICGFEIPPIFLAAATLRLMGHPVTIMQDSKFDDKPRRFLKELFKRLLYAPYSAALVGSPRSKSYLEFLGLSGSRIFLGYDAVSMDRLTRLAAAEPAPGGMPHASRHFTIIARFVPQKNLATAIEAYALYRREHPGMPRELHLCGSGRLEETLRQQVARLGIGGVHFRGYVQEETIAKTLASTLALILPSIEEPFGLVINEALALGVPVIVSENCGARDLLVRTGVNGYVIEPDNIGGLAHFMRLLDQDAAEWARLAANCSPFRAVADTECFAIGVEEVIAALAPRSTRRRHFQTQGCSGGPAG
jgi:glycosyltransferase involved in cell wall biosynthesis